MSYRVHGKNDLDHLVRNNVPSKVGKKEYSW